MAWREYIPPAPIDVAALEIGVIARELRCDLGLYAPELAAAHGWTGGQWFDAEQGRRGVAAAQFVLDATRTRRDQLEFARQGLLAEIEAA